MFYVDYNASNGRLFGVQGHWDRGQEPETSMTLHAEKLDTRGITVVP
jgi:hypothetical protein